MKASGQIAEKWPHIEHTALLSIAINNGVRFSFIHDSFSFHGEKEKVEACIQEAKKLGYEVINEAG